MIGQTISHYKILEKLGEGGMGVVYKAQDLKLDRLVALKFLPQNITPTEAEKARFIHEAKAASALDHPNICNIHEIDETPDGQVFIAMAFYEGTPLNKKVEQGPLKLEEAVDIAIQIAEGLHAAHMKDIIHRDIKSSNVMVTESGHIKILDFGLAKRAGATLLTKGGATVGTVPYMSPEQARGEKVDHRTDIWSLGIVLYEMITGRLPFRSEYNEALVYSILNEDPPPPTSLRSDVPMELERIVKKAMQKEHKNRYQHVDEIAADLRALKLEVTSEGGRAAVSSAKPRLKKRTYAYVSVGVIALIAIAVALLTNWLPTKEKFESLAVLPLENMGRDPNQEYFVDGMTEALTAELSKISALRVISRTSAMLYKGVKKPLPQIAHELNVDALIEGSVLREGDQVRITVQLIQGSTDKHLWAESYQRELRGVLVLQSEMARAIAREIGMRVSPEDRVRLASARRVNPEALELSLKGRYFWNQRTDEGLMKSIEYFQQAIATDPSYALGYAGLADSYNILGSNRLRDPKEVFPKARTAAERALKLDENLAEAHAVLGAIKYNYEWDWAGARRALQRAIELNPGYATAHQRYGWLSSMLGEHNVAIEEMKLARRLDPLSARISANVGHVLFLAREYEQAIVELRKTLELYPNDVAAHGVLREIYVQKGMYSEAIRESKEVLRSAPDAVTALGGLGYAYAVSGDKTEAAKVLNKLQGMWKREPVVSTQVAWIYIGLGDIDRAFQWLEKAYQDRDPSLSYIRVHPYFDRLRSDPRFQDLLRRMNLPN